MGRCCRVSRGDADSAASVVSGGRVGPTVMSREDPSSFARQKPLYSLALWPFYLYLLIYWYKSRVLFIVFRLAGRRRTRSPGGIRTGSVGSAGAQVSSP